MFYLDLSIYFYHVTGLIICFISLFLLNSSILIKYWYNKKIRFYNVNLHYYEKFAKYSTFIKKLLKT
jgi:hypothetical protein